MNTDKMTVTENRDVAPQWAAGRGANLGEFTLPFVGISPEGVQALAEKPEFRTAMSVVLNNQLGIQFNSRLCKERVLAELKAKGIVQTDEEKWPEFAARTLADAQEIAKSVLPGFTMDAFSAFQKWAVEDLPKRGQRADKRPTLEKYDDIVAGVEAYWATMSQEKRVALCERLKLNVPEGTTAADVVAAIAAKYVRPVAVATDDLFE